MEPSIPQVQCWTEKTEKTQVLLKEIGRMSNLKGVLICFAECAKWLLLLKLLSVEISMSNISMGQERCHSKTEWWATGY